MRPSRGRYRREYRRRRRRLVGGENARSKRLDFIYARDRGICWWCRWYVLRSEASQEHLLPIRHYPDLGRDTRWIVLAHRLCNK